MFSIVSVTGAFKRRVSGAQQHEAGPGQSNVTFQIEPRDTVFPGTDSIWKLCVRQQKPSPTHSFPLHVTPHTSKVSYLFDFLHAFDDKLCLHQSKSADIIFA